MNPWTSIESLSRAQIDALQNERLSTFISDYVYPFSPHYRRVFQENRIDPAGIRTVKDLSKIPFTSKLDFIDTPETPSKFKEFILQPDQKSIRESWGINRKIPLALRSLVHGKERVLHDLNKEFRPAFMTFTTGTTNKPVPFTYSNHDIDNLYVSGARMLRLIDVKNTESIVNMFPYAPHLAFWQVVFAGFASCTMILNTGGGKVLGTEGNIQAIQKTKPSVLLGVPSYVYHVLREAKERKVDMSSIKKVVLGASRVTEGFKQKLAQLLEDMGGKDIAVFGTYGFTEARCAWAECPTALDVSSGYHLYPDKEIIEIIDPETGEVKGDGEDGEIVFTSLDARGSVVLRYRTGDFVRGGVRYEPCPHCRRQVPRLSSDITRLSDVKGLNLSKVKGTLVNLSNIDAMMQDIEVVDEWQVEIRKKDNDPFEVDELVMYVCTKDDSTKAQIKTEIMEKMALSMEVKPNDVVFVPRDDMIKRLQLEVANKEKRIIDNRPKE